MEDRAGVQESSISSHANDEVDLVSQIHGRTEHGDLVLDGFKGWVMTEILLKKGMEGKKSRDSWTMYTR